MSILPRIALLPLLANALVAIAQQAPPPDPFGGPYAESCSVCHGKDMEGAAQGTPLAGVKLKHGDSIPALIRSISEGQPAAGMPGWSATMDADKIRRLATLIAERRANYGYVDFKVALPPALPADAIRSERHGFRLEEVATGLDRLPYSLAPLPDGRMLVTEKVRGLRIVAEDGSLSPLIKGTPQAFDDGFEMPGLRIVYGIGAIMDVALHPDYANNGWIYLHYSERCSQCNESSRKSKRPVSMNTLVRGRIRDGEWVDQQTIWRADIEQYTSMIDMAAGGRIAFDGKGHVFLSVGIKGGSEFAGVQDLSLPYGKIHRVNDDGSIPADNPFVKTAGALPSIWTYGHRSPQGLEFDRDTGRLWSTEMGPRGGDEVNLLLPGRNYGWPLYSKGMNYDGTPVAYGKQLGIELDMNQIEQPKVDLTPSPAVSSFVIYKGAAFPKWKGNLLVGTLKATELYRMEFKGDRAVHTETLVSGLGRIRDVSTDSVGRIYLLIENAAGSRIVRLVPAGR